VGAVGGSGAAGAAGALQAEQMCRCAEQRENGTALEAAVEPRAAPLEPPGPRAAVVVAGPPALRLKGA